MIKAEGSKAGATSREATRTIVKDLGPTALPSSQAVIQAVTTRHRLSNRAVGTLRDIPRNRVALLTPLDTPLLPSHNRLLTRVGTPRDPSMARADKRLADIAREDTSRIRAEGMAVRDLKTAVVATTETSRGRPRPTRTVIGVTIDSLTNRDPKPEATRDVIVRGHLEGSDLDRCLRALASASSGSAKPEKNSLVDRIRVGIERQQETSWLSKKLSEMQSVLLRHRARISQRFAPICSSTRVLDK